MNEEGRAYRDELTLKSLVRKFEDMVEQGDQAFFDVDELEGLIEHYLEHKAQRKAQAVLRYSCQLYPGNLTLKFAPGAGMGRHRTARKGRAIAEGTPGNRTTQRGDFADFGHRVQPNVGA